MINGNTKVVVSGFGESEYPNIPTFQELTTLDNSLSMIKKYLKVQKEYYGSGYLFTINLLEDGDFIYCYLDGDITISRAYKEDNVVYDIIHKKNNSI